MANKIINNSGSGMTFTMNSFNNSVRGNLISKNLVGIMSKGSGFNKISQNNLFGNQGDNIKWSN